MQIKKFITTIALSTVLIAGAVTVSAQGGRGHNGRGFANHELVETYTGLTGEDLRDAFADGSTLAQLIEANGQSVDAFIADAISQMQTRLDERVADGTIDQATADERLAQFTENLAERINQVPEFNGEGRGQRGFRLGNSELVETYTGLNGEDLRNAFADGSTLAQLIEANGQSVDAFIAEVLAEMQAHLDERVADGTIDQATADERLAQFTENLAERINQVPEFNGEGRGQRGNRPDFGGRNN